MSAVQQTEFQKWYGENKEEFNAKRRKRYQRDKAYRESQLTTTRKWRKRVKKTATPKPAQPRPYLTIGQVAEAVGCDVQTIRSMETKGYIPKTKKGLDKRKYLPKHVRLIKRVYEAGRKYHYTHEKFQATVAKAVEYAQANW